MYKKITNHRTHPKYLLDEKIKIVNEYLNLKGSLNSIKRKYDLSNNDVLRRWIKQYKETGTIVETRGRGDKLIAPNKGRPRKIPEKPLEEYTKEELIERLRMSEDIKKSLVYLMNQKPKKNTK